jgi:single-stranded DNA-binding protein
MINRWTFSGFITRDAEQYDRNGGGFECLLHVCVPTQNGRHVWAAVIWRGKAAEAAFPALVKGRLVFVDGFVGPRDELQGAAIVVNAKTVVVADAMEPSDDRP